MGKEQSDVDSDSTSVATELIEPQEELFDIEKITKSVLYDGETLYRVKWAGFNSSENTWEGIETFKNCPEIITNYEKEVKAKEEKKLEQALNRKLKAIRQKQIKRKVNEKSSVQEKGQGKQNPQEDGLEGFDKGYEPDKILEATTTSTGEMLFLMKWKDAESVDLVRASVANVKCPQVVIAFYEKRVEFLW